MAIISTGGHMIADSIRPIFILSLPRSGSTLLQRIIAAHSKIDTVTEPWILLPLLYGFKSNGVSAEYGHRFYTIAFADFIDTLKGGRQAYMGTVRHYATSLYQKSASDGATYFVDKTPRYSLIIDEILEAFPDAKFIFLWRNPLSVVSSIIDSFLDGRWNLSYFKIDLYNGLENLIRSYENTRQYAMSVRYEDLVTEPTSVIPRIFNFLEVEFESKVAEEFSLVRLKGRFGDKKDDAAYKSISLMSLEKWKNTYGNPLRKAWAKGYLNWLGAERMATMGYNFNQIRSELNEIPFGMKFIGSDIVNMAYGAVSTRLQTATIRRSLIGRPSRHHIVKFT